MPVHKLIILDFFFMLCLRCLLMYYVYSCDRSGIDPPMCHPRKLC